VVLGIFRPPRESGRIFVAVTDEVAVGRVIARTRGCPVVTVADGEPRLPHQSAELRADELRGLTISKTHFRGVVRT
jgi:hypothetical protein